MMKNKTWNCPLELWFSIENNHESFESAISASLEQSSNQPINCPQKHRKSISKFLAALGATKYGVQNGQISCFRFIRCAAVDFL